MKSEIKTELISLYELYGFNKIEENDNYITFQHNKGYFNNIEIVVITSNFDINKVKKEYSECGYAVTVRNFTSIDKTHKDLFLGFFNVEMSHKRINTEYQKFCELQTQKKVSKSEYSYIECNYTINGETGTNSLVECITNEMGQQSAKLIIVEAAAGYGKTCTSYEVLHSISVAYADCIPLIAELSKNRKASIFRYVLLSEINANFSDLSYEVVEHEIMNGNVPLIIDGFDELLSKSIDSQHENCSEILRDSQTMLDTISYFLLNGSKAKVILTSRKSSIFTGDVFDLWIENRQLECDICRIQLDTPNVVKWLGREKSEYIKTNMNELLSITSPILLDVVSELPLDSLPSYTTENIIETYFEKLMTRERERQALALSEIEQREIIRQLASFFVEVDISSEEPKYLSEVMEMLIGDKIGEYISRYSQTSDVLDESIPNKDEFLSKLVHHAFLDRVNSTKNNIGFINEFTFGYFIGEALLANTLTPEQISYKYLDLASTSFSFRGEKARMELFNKTASQINKCECSQRLYLEERLLKRPSSKHESNIFSSIRFSATFTFVAEYVFHNCSFYDCIFDGCTISTNAFIECQFINCKFFSPNIIDSPHDKNELVFISCVGHEHFCESVSQYTPHNTSEKSYRLILLEQFWKPGKAKAEKRCGIYTVYRGMDKNDMCFIDEELKKLINDGFITKKSVCYELNFSRIDEIKAILGR